MSHAATTGTLYLVATPIGNLEDLTLRALRVLKQVDWIAAEDTRVTRKLTAHFGIETRLVSFHQHARRTKMDWLIDQLKSGRSVALVSSAGTPVVSDPGADLVRRCAEEGIAVAPVPGAAALLAALSASGFDGQQFAFLGFVPKKSGARKRALAPWRDSPLALIVYESPERVGALLLDASEALGNREAAVARELTKKFEEIARGRLQELAESWQHRDARGEFTVVIRGAEARAADRNDELALSRAVARACALMADGQERSAALRLAALECGVKRNELYAALLRRYLPSEAEVALPGAASLEAAARARAVSR